MIHDACLIRVCLDELVHLVDQDLLVMMDPQETPEILVRGAQQAPGDLLAHLVLLDLQV